MLRVIYLTIFLCIRYCAAYIYPLSQGGSKPFVSMMSPLEPFGELIPKLLSVFDFGQPQLTFIDNLLIWSHLKEPTTSYVNFYTSLGFFLTLSGMVGLFYFIFWRNLECPNDSALSLNLPINYPPKNNQEQMGINHLCMGPRCGSPCSDCLNEFDEMHKAAAKLSKTGMGLPISSQGDGPALNDA